MLKLRSLLIIAQNAGPKELKAGHRLAFEFAKETAKTCKLDVVLLINNKDVVDYSAWNDIGVEIIYLEIFGSIKKIFAVLQNILSVPPRFCSRISEKAKLFISDIVATARYDEVIFEFSQSMPYIDAVKNDSSVKKIASIHLECQKSYASSNR